MDNRTLEANASATPPTAPATPSIGYPQKGNPGTGTAASKGGVFWYYQIGEELRNVLLAAGLTPTTGDLTQIVTSIKMLIEARAGNYVLDTGVANAYVVALSPEVTAYTNGMEVRVKIVNANTTAATLNAGGGAVPLVNDVGSALVSGDLPANCVISAVYDSTANKFIMTSRVPSQAMSQAAADARYVGLAAAGSAVGQFRNLQASSTGLNANVSVSADEIVLENGTNLYQTVRAVALTIAGTSVGANGLDTGAIAASTWYSLWVIWNGTTIAGLMSLSATAPTLPSGYTHKARVGWIRTDGTANKYPLSFKQYGRKVQYVQAAGTNLTALPSMASGTTAGPTAIGVANFVPSTAAAIAVSIYGSYNNTAYGGWVMPNSTYSYSNAPIENSTAYTGAVTLSTSGWMLLESANIYWGATGGSTVCCFGWEDNI
jgi:hypothetical protein